MKKQTASQKLSAKIKTATQKLQDMKTQLVALKDKEKSQTTSSKPSKVKKPLLKRHRLKKQRVGND